MDSEASNLKNGHSKCPFNGDHGELIWTKTQKSIELKNYQTNQSLKVTGPTSTLYEDCRHQVCTSTLMSLSAHTSVAKCSETNKGLELQSDSVEYIAKEAHDFLSMYKQAKGLSEELWEVRLKEIDDEIRRNGLYTHTTNELEYGCQLAWRNSARCVNRLYWPTLKVIDRRAAKTNNDMFVAICEHLRLAYNQGALQATVLVLGRHSRLWSTQYLRFACYENPDGSFVGDPMNRELTKVAMKLGWNKPNEERTPWDLLPIIVQCNSETAPSWFELPEDLRPIVFLSHPDPKYDAAIKLLGLRWVAQPFVADKAIEIGGIVYKCVPFSGWFMQTEIGRNLCDIQRYNMIPKLAHLLDLDVTAASFAQLNIDRLYVEINAAILHSFQRARVTIVDHHTAAAGFMKFMRQEIKERGNTPADWIWLVPPISGGMSVLFHQEMFNYVIKPRVLDQREPWINYASFRMMPTNEEKSAQRCFNRVSTILYATSKLLIRAMRVKKRSKACIDVLYASNTGTAKSYAEQTKRRLMNEGYHATLKELDQYSFSSKKKTSSVVIIITSTFGEGNSPDGGQKVEEWLRYELDRINNRSNINIDDQSRVDKSLKWCTYALCALGSSAYTNFCGFGKLIDHVFHQILAANRLLPLATCDALDKQQKNYNQWEDNMINALKDILPIASLHAQEPDYIPLRFDIPMDATIEDYPIQEFCTKENPYYAKVLKNIELTGSFNGKYSCSTEESETLSSGQTKFEGMPKFDVNYCNQEFRSVRLIVLDSTGLQYQPGDHVCILAENSIQDVNKILRRCDWKYDDPRLDQPCSLGVLTKNRQKTLRELLTCFVDLTAILQPNTLRAMAIYASDDNEQQRLFKLGEGTTMYEEWIKNRPRIQDTLNEFPSLKISIDKLIQILPSIRPRYYSISSSNDYYPNELHITVSVVTHTTAHGIHRKGLCSNYLLRTIPRLDRVRIFISPNPRFRLPAPESSQVLNCPLLMFAVGSGIAPFRSFWQQLELMQRVEKSNLLQVERVLFMGVRRPSDLLYAKELEDLLTESKQRPKILTRFIPVYSRMGATVKKYIQHVVLERKDIVYSLLIQTNAHIYLCGSIQSCLEIEAALASVIQMCDPKNLSMVEGQNMIKQLEQEGRLKKDMFG